MSSKSSLPVSVGLDVGSAHVRCVIGLQEAEDAHPSIIGVGVAKSGGVRKGTVADIEETVSAITASIDEAERIAGIQVHNATVGVNGNHLLTVVSHGIIAVGSSGRDITDQDTARVEEAATVMQLPPNREIIQVYPRNYTVDGQDHVPDPVGMNGMRLEVDSCLITGGTPFIKNLGRSVNQAGFHINRLISNPLAASNAVLTKQDKELGCVLLDIGAMTTGMAVFEEGELLHVGVLPVGAAHISNDLAIGLRTDIETAEKIKLQHVSALSEQKGKGNRNIRIKEGSGEEIIITQQEVDSIAQDRLKEILHLVEVELKKLKKDSMLPAGAVLVGGGARLKNIDEYVKQQLRLPARIAKPEGYSGVADKVAHPEFAVAVGLMLGDSGAGQSSMPLGNILKSGEGFVKNLINRFRH